MALRGEKVGKLRQGRDYAAALGLVVGATVTRWFLNPLVGAEAVPFITFFLANAVAMLLLRAGPSLCTILLGALAADWFFLTPTGAVGGSLASYLSVGIFVAGNLVVLILAQSMHRARAQAEANVRAARERSALLDIAPVFGWNFDRAIIMWGRGAEALYGYTAAEALGRMAHELLNTQYPQPVEQIREQLLRQGKWEGELVHQCKDGSRLIVLSQWVLQRDENGAPLAVLETNRDITQRKHAENALREAKEALARSNAELDEKVRERTAKLEEMVGELEQFSYTITHDMRSPLRAMQGFGQMLLDECADCMHSKRLDAIRRITAAAERMDHLIIDALNYSKIVRQELGLAPIEPKALLQGILESYPQLQPPKAEVLIDGDFPTLLGNQAGLTQCFSNLLTNAVKFVLPHQIPKVRVWAETVDTAATPVPGRGSGDARPSSTNGKYVRIWFEDNGIGIPKEYHDKIWVMFQRLSKSYEGTGIGLALVRKVVERMKGRVGVESEPGKGSRFWVELQAA